MDDLAKYAKANIIIWNQGRKAENPKVISKSLTNYTDNINLVTKSQCHPFSYSKLQIDTEKLKERIHKTQSNKLCEMTVWEALSQWVDISKEEFIEKWGTAIKIETEVEFAEEFHFGYSIYSNLDNNFYTAELVYNSLNPKILFITNPSDGDCLDLDLNVVVISDKSYLQPYHCTKTENCPYKVR